MPPAPNRFRPHLLGAGLTMLAAALGALSGLQAAPGPAGASAVAAAGSPAAATPTPVATPTATPTPPPGPAEGLAFLRGGENYDAEPAAIALLAEGRVPPAVRRAIGAKPAGAERLLALAADPRVPEARFLACLAEVPPRLRLKLDDALRRLGDAAEQGDAGTTGKCLALLARRPNEASAYMGTVAETCGAILEKGGDRRTAPGLIALARGRAVKVVPGSWSQAVVAMGSVADRPALRALLRDPRPDRRLFAIGGLHGHGDARDLPELVAATRDREHTVALYAMRAAIDHHPAGRRAALRAVVAAARGPAAGEGQVWLAMKPPEPSVGYRFDPLATPSPVPSQPTYAASMGPLTEAEIRRLLQAARDGEATETGRYVEAFTGLLTPANVPLLWRAADVEGQDRAWILAALATCAPATEHAALRTALAAAAPAERVWPALAAIGTADQVPELVTRGALASAGGRDTLGVLGGPAAIAALTEAHRKDPGALLPLVFAGGHPSDVRQVAPMLGTYATWKVMTDYVANGLTAGVNTAQPQSQWFLPWAPDSAWMNAHALDALRAARRMPDARLGPWLYPLLDRAPALANDVHATLVAPPYDRDEAGLARAMQGASETLAARLSLVRAGRLVAQGEAARAERALAALAATPVVLARPELAARVALQRLALAAPADQPARQEALERQVASSFAPIDHTRFPDLARRLTYAKARALLAAGRAEAALALVRGSLSPTGPVEPWAIAYQASRRLDGAGPASRLTRALDEQGRSALAAVFAHQLGHAAGDVELRSPYFQESNSSLGGDMDREHYLAMQLWLDRTLQGRRWARMAAPAWDALKAGGDLPPWVLSR